MSTRTPATGGLRERKKARTRWAIQEHALRLFAEQGYDATTVDQIAAAAEISPSTFFRYFRTKEDVVVQDEFDEQIVEAFRTAAQAEDVLGSLRASIVSAIAGVDGTELAKSEQRSALIMTVPALRARSMENLLTAYEDAVHGFAEGAGRSPGDPAVRAFVGAVLGAAIPLIMSWAADSSRPDFAGLFDQALSSLQEIIRWPSGAAPVTPG